MKKTIVKDYLKKGMSYLPEEWRDTLMLQGLGLFKIPMIFFLRPKVVTLNQSECTIMIPLTRRSRNHLGSLYLGAFAVGADIAGGMAAMKVILEKDIKVSLAFKDLHIDFLKRSHGDTFFTCTQIPEVVESLEKTLQSGERVNQTLTISAWVKGPTGEREEVALSHITLSLKAKKSN